jgi:phosphatidylglycerophosphatase A
VLLIGSIAAAVWLCIRFAGMLNQKDPQLIVIDEIVGFLCREFLFSFQPHRVALKLCIVALLRYVDKILPANRLERLPRRGHCAG